MAKFENLRVRGWYAVYEIDQGEPSEPVPWVPQPPRIRAYDGLPLQVLALSYPFVLVRLADGRQMTFDVRVVTLTALDARYVRAYGQQTDSALAEPAKKRRKKTKPDRWTCPRCGGPIIQKMVRVTDGWRFSCRDCGYDQGPVSNPPPKRTL